MLQRTPDPFEPLTPAREAALGAVAGAIGVWALDRVDWFMWDREPAASKARTTAVRPGGEPPAQALVSKGERATGLAFSPGRHEQVSQFVHYSIGVAPAAAYGALRDKLPVSGAARGLLYGLTLFALQDEMLNTVAGLGAKPADYPWRAHARGVVAHAVYGVVTELVLTGLQRAVARR